MLVSPLHVHIEKRASATRLEKDPEEWPGEIVSEAYRQLPYIAAFETDLEMQRVDGARGYAVGRLLVYPAKLQKEAAAQQKRLVALPVIVRDREMAPLDVYQHQEGWHPLVEQRVQEILHTPATFSRPAPVGTFQGTDLSSQIDPGAMDRYAAQPYEKTASVFQAALGTFRAEDTEAFKARLREDTTLRVAYTSVPDLRAATEALVGHKEVTASALRSRRAAETPPTVVQFVEDGTGYIMKSANHKAFKATAQRVTRFDAEKVLTKEAMQRLKARGRVTFVVDPVVNGEGVEKTAQEVNRVGAWSTWSGDRQLHGIAIPAMVSLDGQALDLQLFAGAGDHAMQEKVAGVFEGDVVLPEARPMGEGVFVYQRGAMGVATEPIVIQSRVTVGEKEKTAEYHGYRSTTGQRVVIEVVPGLKKIASAGPGRYAIPDTLRFLPLNGALVEVAATPDLAETFELDKLAASSSVQLHCNSGGAYWVTGENAEAFRGCSFDAERVEFALGALGVHEKQARGFMEKAASDGRVAIPRTRLVGTEDAVKEAMMVKVAAAFHKVPALRVDLVREAAALAIPSGKEKVAAEKETVDAVLSLGFITPENVAVYIDYIPELEKVSGKLAEILVASRLGMDTVKENAARNALTQLSTVIDGLQTMQQQVQ